MRVLLIRAERRQSEQQWLDLPAGARVRDALQGLVTACPGHGALNRCPILAALSEDHA